MRAAAFEVLTLRDTFGTRLSTSVATQGRAVAGKTPAAMRLQRGHVPDLTDAVLVREHVDAGGGNKSAVNSDRAVGPEAHHVGSEEVPVRLAARGVGRTQQLVFKFLVIIDVQGRDG